MRVLDRHGSRLDGAYAVGHVALGWLGQRQTAKAMLDRYLPRARRREEQLRARILYQGQVFAKALGSRLKPKEDVGVEEQLQRSNVRSRSSGSGASKSAGTAYRSRSIPRRRTPVGPAGTRRATCSPRRVMTISSPAETRSSSRDRFVFASCTPTDLVMDLVYLPHSERTPGKARGMARSPPPRCARHRPGVVRGAPA